MFFYRRDETKNYMQINILLIMTRRFVIIFKIVLTLFNFDVSIIRTMKHFMQIKKHLL